jgi:hypothetical protein
MQQEKNVRSWNKIVYSTEIHSCHEWDEISNYGTGLASDWQSESSSANITMNQTGWYPTKTNLQIHIYNTQIKNQSRFANKQSNLNTVIDSFHGWGWCISCQWEALGTENNKPATMTACNLLSFI